MGSSLNIPSLRIEFTPLPILVSFNIFAVIGRFFNALTNFLKTYRSFYFEYSFFSLPRSLISEHILKIGGIPKHFTNFFRAG